MLQAYRDHETYNLLVEEKEAKKRAEEEEFIKLPPWKVYSISFFRFPFAFSQPLPFHNRESW